MENYGFDVYEIIEIKDEHIVIDDDDSDEDSKKLPTSSYKCDVCFLSFPIRAQKIAHCKTHLGEKLFKCDFCPRAFQKEILLKEHVNYKHTQMFSKYKCNRCMNSFSRKKDFVNHRSYCLKMDKKAETKTYKCEKCDKIYASLLFLKVHMKRHT